MPPNLTEIKTFYASWLLIATIWKKSCLYSNGKNNRANRNSLDRTHRHYKVELILASDRLIIGNVPQHNNGPKCLPKWDPPLLPPRNLTNLSYFYLVFDWVIGSGKLFLKMSLCSLFLIDWADSNLYQK